MKIKMNKTMKVKLATDKDFEKIMRPYINDYRTAKIFENPIIRRETIGNYNDVLKIKKNYMSEFKKKISTYGSNHIIQISKYMKKGDHILELAAANGWASAILRNIGFKNILVTDINPFDYTGLSGIRHFTKYPMKNRLMSFENIDLPKKSFDVVFMCSSLHHSSNVGKVAKQVNGVLKKNGKWFIIGEPVRGLFDVKNKSMEESNADGFNDKYYYWWHYRREIKKSGFSIKVLFPDELDKMLKGDIAGNASRWYKQALFPLFKSIYSFGIGRKIVRATYPISLYLIGSHSIILCEKRRNA